MATSEEQDADPLMDANTSGSSSKTPIGLSDHLGYQPALSEPDRSVGPSPKSSTILVSGTDVGPDRPPVRKDRQVTASDGSLVIIEFGSG